MRGRQGRREPTRAGGARAAGGGARARPQGGGAGGRRPGLAVLAILGALAAAAVALRPWQSARPPVTPPATAPVAPAGPTVAHRRPPVAGGRLATVPILMYHVIGDPYPGAPFPGLYVSAADFAAQMRALAAAGFQAVTLDRLWAAWHGRATLPPHPIVLTFDNGYRSQYTRALPVLRRLRWPGDENLQLTGLPPSQGGLSPWQVRALLVAGWELDTQGYSHADLSRVDAAQLRFQVATARRLLARRYHVPVHWFAYPSGRYNPTVVAAVRTAGYRGATTVVPGWARASDDPYALPRLRVLRGTSPRALLAEIAAARNAPPPPAAYPTG